MYTDQTINAVSSALALPLMFLVIIGIVLIIIAIIFFIKIWNACTDIWKIRMILEDNMPVQSDSTDETSEPVSK